MPFRHRHLLSRALPQLHKSRGEAKELLASWSECGTSFVSNEKRSPKLPLKQAYAGADGCLSDMQALGSLNETPRGDDL